MQTIKTKHFGPISFIKTWASSDGRHIGKLAKGGYAHLSGSQVTSEKDLKELIPDNKDRKEALEWFENKDKPQTEKSTKSLMLTSDGGYIWEDGTEITNIADVYNTIKEGPQLEAVLLWFTKKQTKKKEDDKNQQTKEKQDRMAHARSMIGKKKAA